MDSNVSVAVIIPAYNAQNTIASCLESIYSQTFKNIAEIIVVNDGSTDETELICRNFIRSTNQQPYLKIFSQSNAGPSKARNLGISKSTSTWIAFLDADDVWLPNKLQNQFNVINVNPNCMLMGTLLYKDKKVYTKSHKTITFFSMLFKNEFLTSTIVVKREILVKYYFDEKKKYSEDYKLWLQITFRHQAILLLEGLVHYSPYQAKNPNSLSKKLLKMELGELDNFNYLINHKMINYFSYILAVLFSLLKYFYRLFQFFIENIFNRPNK
ncbi:MAG: glycosyltransferase family 2 protein [Patescibacteria group bacterium]